MTIFLIVLGVVLIIAGLAGTIHPAIPGLPMMFAGTISLAYAHDFHYVGTITIVIAAVIMVIGMAMDFVAGLLGAKMTGASKKALWGAFIGGLLGMFWIPIGIIFGPLVGAAIGEYIEVKDSYKAGKVGVGTFVGFIVGTVAKIGCALVMMLLVVFAYIF